MGMNIDGRKVMRIAAGGVAALLLASFLLPGPVERDRRAGEVGTGPALPPVEAQPGVPRRLPATATATDAPETAPTPPVPNSPDIPDMPRLDVVRIDGAGATVVAGKGAAGAEVVLRLDGLEIATAQSDAQGNFASLFDVGTSTAPRMLTVESRGAGGRVTHAADGILVGPNDAAMTEATDTTAATEIAPRGDYPAGDAASGAANATGPAGAIVVSDVDETARVAVAGAADGPALLDATMADASPATSDPGPTGGGPFGDARGDPAGASSEADGPRDDRIMPAAGPETPLDDVRTRDVAGSVAEGIGAGASARDPAVIGSDDGAHARGQVAGADGDATQDDVLVASAGPSDDGASEVSRPAIPDIDAAAPLRNATIGADVSGIARPAAGIEDAGVVSRRPNPVAPPSPDGAATPEATLPPPTIARAAPGLAPVAPVAPGATRTPPSAPPSVAGEAPVDATPPRLFRAGPDGVTALAGIGTPPAAREGLGIDSIAYDAAGEVSIAGRAAPDAQLRIYLDDRPVRLAQVGPDGVWTSPLPDLQTGIYTLRVDALDPDGTVTSRVETPFERTAPEIAAAARRSGVTAITVQPGFTLWAISEGYFGDGIRYVQIFEANRDLIRDPDLIYPGQVFALPGDAAVEEG